MKLDYLMLADRVQQDDSGKIIVTGAGITHVSVDRLPVAVGSMSAIARFLLEPGDSEVAEPVRIQLRLHRPDGSVAGQSEMFEVSRDQLVRPRRHEGEEHASFFVVNLDSARFDSYGLYTVDLVVDDEVVGRRPIVVVTPHEGDDLPDIELRRRHGDAAQ